MRADKDSMIEIPYSSASCINYPELEHIEPQWVEHIQSLIHGQSKKAKTKTDFSPIAPPKNRSYYEVGKKAYLDGKVAFLVVAGGQATRLGSNLPKALVPITPYRKVHNLKRIVERLQAFHDKYNKAVPTALMVNPYSKELIKKELKKLSDLPIQTLVQPLIPIFNDQGQFFLSDKNKVALAPGGNGCSLKLLHNAPFYPEWQKAGVEHILFFQIDNPLYNPFDFELIGQHIAHENQATILAIHKRSAEEKVGTLVQTDKGPRVVEYSELENHLPLSEISKYPYANISIFAFNQVALSIASADKDPFPWHLAHKKSPFLDRDNEVVKPEKPNSFKAEQFIFDILDSLSKVQVHERKRFDCFSPLKNASGSDSLETVHRDLTAYDQWFYHQLTGKGLKDGLELHPSIYLLEKNKSDLQQIIEDRFCMRTKDAFDVK